MHPFREPVTPARRGLAAYASIAREDALAIAAHLKSLTPVSHRVPASVNPGETAPAPLESSD